MKIDYVLTVQISKDFRLTYEIAILYTKKYQQLHVVLLNSKEIKSEDLSVFLQLEIS